MTTEIVSCRTIQYEVEKAIRDTGCNYPVSWVESGLHNFPKKLGAALQKIFDGIKAERVLLAMGFCGNSLAGLKTFDFELIYPRVDDCITLLLGSYERRKDYDRTYFLTKGWLDGERNIYEEYKYTIAKYGPEQGGDILDMLFGQYMRLGVLNTGTCDYGTLVEQCQIIGRDLKLEVVQIEATDKLMKSLLSGPWPEERFRIIHKWSEIAPDDLKTP